MRLWLAFALSAAGLCAQPTISNISAAPYSRSSIVLVWTTDVNSSTYLKYGEVGASFAGCTYGTETATCKIAYSEGVGQYHTRVAGGLATNHAYDLQPCGQTSGVEGCGTRQTVSTLTGSATVDEPAAPAPTDEFTIPTGGTLRTVAADCSDLQAKWDAVVWGDILELPSTNKCASFEVYNLSTTSKGSNPLGKYILVRTAGTVGNETARVISTKTGLAKIIHNHFQVVNDSRDLTGTDACFAGDLYWRIGQANAWALYQCNNVLVGTVSSWTSSGNAIATISSHGVTDKGNVCGTGNMGFITGVTGAGAATVSGAFFLKVVDANTIQLRDCINGNITATGAASGGQLYVNTYQLVPVTTGASVPGSCTWDTWFHLTGGGADEFHRNYYCDQDGTYVPINFNLTSNYGESPIKIWNSSHVILANLEMDVVHVKYNAQRLQYKYAAASQPGGPMFQSFVRLDYLNDHVYFNRIKSVPPDPSPTGSLVSVHAFAQPFDGSHLGVTHSYLGNFQQFMAQKSLYDGSSAVLANINGGNHIKVHDNYIGCAGICVYFSGDNTGFSPLTDVTITKNTVETPDKYWNMSPSWIGLDAAFNGLGPYWSQRHRVELKHGTRFLIDGNILFGGWQWNNDAAAICVCSRTGEMPQVSDMGGGDGKTITLYGQQDGYGDYRMPSVNVGDQLYFYAGFCSGGGASIMNTLYTVTAVDSNVQVHVNTSTGCGGTRGNVHKVLAASDVIQDVIVSNNTIHDVPTGITVLPTGTSGQENGVMAARVKLVNNLITSVDERRIMLGGSYSPSNPAVTPGGKAIKFVGGAEDAQIIHNTIHPIFSDVTTANTNAIQLDTNCTNWQKGSRLVVKFNIVAGDSSATSIANCNTVGTAGMTAFSQAGIGVAAWTWDTNVVIGPVDPPLSAFTGTAAHTLCAYTGGAVGGCSAYSGLFTNTVALNYTLTKLYRHADTCYSIAGDCTTDGEDVGVDMVALLAAQSANGGLFGARQASIFRATTIH